MAQKALIVIDVQNDFCPGGELAVENGDEIVPLVNHLIASHDHVVLTQDWHPAGHSSFASRPQTLWPDHCVQGSTGSEFHPELEWTRAEMVIRKGFRPEIDSYSAFFENDHATPTGLSGYLKERGIAEVVLAGLATDFCVGFSALDAVTCGFKTSVVMQACRAIDLDGSLAAMTDKMRAAGVHLL